MQSLLNLSLFLAQAPAEGAARNPIMEFAPFILLIVAFWFLLIAPQRKKQKEHTRMISELKTGDKVITSGGLLGTITAVKQDCFQIKVDDSTRIEVLKSFVQSRQSDTPSS